MLILIRHTPTLFTFSISFFSFQFQRDIDLMPFSSHYHVGDRNIHRLVILPVHCIRYNVGHETFVFITNPPNEAKFNTSDQKKSIKSGQQQSRMYII